MEEGQLFFGSLCVVLAVVPAVGLIANSQYPRQNDAEDDGHSCQLCNHQDNHQRDAGITSKQALGVALDPVFVVAVGVLVEGLFGRDQHEAVGKAVTQHDEAVNTEVDEANASQKPNKGRGNKKVHHIGGNSGHGCDEELVHVEFLSRKEGK